MDNSTITTSICRACLSESSELKSVFASEDNSGYMIHLSEMIMACASVQITFGDGLPEQICIACAEQTVKMYLYKLKCEESDKILRERLERSPLQETCNVHEEKYSEYIEMNDYNGTDLNVTIKSEISIEEPHEDEPSDDKNQATFGFNVGENYDSDSGKPVLSGNELYKKEFKCEFCNKTLCNQSSLNQHIKTHWSIKEFECETCNKRFSQKDRLFRHKIFHAKKKRDSNLKFGDFSINDDFEDDTIISKTETELFPCPECSVPFTKKEEMEIHVKQHIKVSSNITCHVCTKKFQKQDYLTRHLRTHGITCICSICNEGFFKPKQLENHMMVHSGVKPHICNICSKSFFWISHLNIHMRTHNATKSFLCSTCHKGFGNLRNLQRHMDRHNGIKPFLCSTCGHKCATKEHLSVHLRKHTGERPFVCSICNRGFSTSGSLTTHKRIHSGEKPYECDVCKMKFRDSAGLISHKRTHTGEKPHVCKFCAKAFSQSGNLIMHLRIHTGEKPYVCKFCAKGCSTSSELKTHVRIHTAEKPYMCDVCGQTFRQSSTLKKHKKTHQNSSGIAGTTVDEGGANSGFLK